MSMFGMHRILRFHRLCRLVPLPIGALLTVALVGFGVIIALGSSQGKAKV